MCENKTRILFNVFIICQEHIDRRRTQVVEQISILSSSKANSYTIHSIKLYNLLKQMSVLLKPFEIYQPNTYPVTFKDS